MRFNSNLASLLVFSASSHVNAQQDCAFLDAGELASITISGVPNSLCCNTMTATFMPAIANMVNPLMPWTTAEAMMGVTGCTISEDVAAAVVPTPVCGEVTTEDGASLGNNLADEASQGALMMYLCANWETCNWGEGAANVVGAGQAAAMAPAFQEMDIPTMCAEAHVYILVYTYICIFMFVYVYTHIYICTCIYAHTHIYIYIYI